MISQKKPIIIDASVITKWFIEENDSDKAEMLKLQFLNGEIDLIAPSLIYYEVLNALKYSNLLNQDKMNIAAESLENYALKISPIQGKTRKTMIDLAIKHRLSIYDASYLALSIILNGTFITADAKIKKNVPKIIKKYIFDLNELKIN